VVDRIITNLGVLDVVEGGLRLVELADGVTEAELRAATEATLAGRLRPDHRGAGPVSFPCRARRRSRR
jgi:acyl CoA:acetate/3-ketoacid CoA transferase beta subunit